MSPKAPAAKHEIPGRWGWGNRAPIVYDAMLGNRCYMFVYSLSFLVRITIILSHLLGIC